MELVLKRLYKKDTYTIGKLYVNGEYFCDTLEDKVRDLSGGESKVYGKTAIPTGTYRVTVNMSQRFKRRMALLLDVPHFTGIRIHRGNTDADTSGCILVGRNTARGKVTNSAVYETRLTALLEHAQSKGENITIKIE